MIKLFRKIRQNLLNEGKTSKYLKYALRNQSNCPTRDNLWVTTKEKMNISVPLGTAYEKYMQIDNTIES